MSSDEEFESGGSGASLVTPKRAVSKL